ELAIAAIAHYGRKNPFVLPDTGSLRDDGVALRRWLSERRAARAVVLSVPLCDFVSAPRTAVADRRTRLPGADGGPTSMERILERAAARGEVDPERLTPRLTTLPIDLVRHEILMTGRPVTEKVIEEIVDDIFLPLVRRRAR